MGYGTRNNGQIKTFWPDDTETTKYLAGEIDFIKLHDLIKAWWPWAKYGDIKISSENIHTDCLTYDLHDSGDYTTFLVITLERNQTMGSED